MRKKKKLTPAQQRQKMRAYSRAYYKAHRARILKQNKAWQKKNKEYMREYAVAYRKKKQKARSAYMKKYHERRKALTQQQAKTQFRLLAVA